MTDALPPNGPLARSRLDAIRIIASLLAALILFECVLIAYCVHTPPAQWDIVTKGLDAMNTLAVALTGGLLTALRPGGGSS